VPDARLQLVDLLRGEADVRQPALVGLVEVVDAHHHFGAVVDVALVEGAVLRVGGGERVDEGDAEEQVGDDPLDVPGVDAGQLRHLPVVAE